MSQIQEVIMGLSESARSLNRVLTPAYSSPTYPPIRGYSQPVDVVDPVTSETTNFPMASALDPTYVPDESEFALPSTIESMDAATLAKSIQDKLDTLENETN